jgi:hypothetical protein
MMKCSVCVSLALALLFTACSKEPGEGGRAEIRGRVLEQNYNGNTLQPFGPIYPKADQRVFIIYGTGTTPDSDVRTGADGSFSFPWLRKGDYTVYTISECGDYRNCTFAVSANANIGSRKDQVDVGDLMIRDYN